MLVAQPRHLTHPHSFPVVLAPCAASRAFNQSLNGVGLHPSPLQESIICLDPRMLWKPRAGQVSRWIREELAGNLVLVPGRYYGDQQRCRGM